jgi:hypothetical protein
MIERETALNRAEKEQYGWFLGHEFFTKSMFGHLDQFYAHTWDKLSEEGKAEMSQRVWEGVRRRQYEFMELPETVKEKEAKQMHSFLTREGTRDRFASAVPIDDQRDFLESYSAGHCQASYAVLNRPGFASAFVDRAQAEVASQDVTDGKSSLKDAIKAGMKMPQIAVSNGTGQGGSLADLNLDDDVLETLKAAQDAPAKSAVNLESSGQQRRR